MEAAGRLDGQGPLGGAVPPAHVDPCAFGFSAVQIDNEVAAAGRNPDVCLRLTAPPIADDSEVARRILGTMRYKRAERDLIAGLEREDSEPAIDPCESLVDHRGASAMAANTSGSTSSCNKYLDLLSYESTIFSQDFVPSCFS
ncbi:MAG: hypothetical protein USCAAHI_01432 [Beijerinckiaceae bacterium]|nr:MAG: hypothetical protein USCAAHI_01432 [Beijerinckiaceae bacterium]